MSISMYNDNTRELIEKNGHINLIECVAIIENVDIDILKDYYKFYNKYPKLSISLDTHFKLFERRYKILKILNK